MRVSRERILTLAALLICTAASSYAGGPAFIAGSGWNPGVEGQPLVWANASVLYFTDQGDLSPILPNAQADAFALQPPLSLPGLASQVSPSPHLRVDTSPRT